MGKRREPTPEDEIWEFSKRISKIEGGLRASVDPSAWRRFVRDRILEDRGYEATPAQLEVTERGRIGIYEELPGAGFRFEHHVTRGKRRYLFRHVSSGRITPWRLAEEAWRRKDTPWRVEGRVRAGRARWWWRNTQTGKIAGVSRWFLGR